MNVPGVSDGYRDLKNRGGKSGHLMRRKTCGQKRLLTAIEDKRSSAKSWSNLLFDPEHEP